VLSGAADAHQQATRVARLTAIKRAAQQHQLLLAAAGTRLARHACAQVHLQLL
jgi:hypothetical protein